MSCPQKREETSPTCQLWSLWARSGGRMVGSAPHTATGSHPQPHSSPPHTTPQSPEQPTHKAWSTKRTLPLKLEAASATNTTLFLQLARKNKSHVCFLGTLQMVRANMQEELTGSSAKTKVSMQWLKLRSSTFCSVRSRRVICKDITQDPC